MNKLEQFILWKNEKTILSIVSYNNEPRRIIIEQVWHGTIFGLNAVIKINYINDSNEKTGFLIIPMNYIKIYEDEDDIEMSMYDHEIRMYE